MYSTLLQQAEYVQHLDKDQLKSWLLKSFATGNFLPLLLTPQPSAAIQMQQIFLALDPQHKEVFKAATVQAVAEWMLPGYEPETLKELATLAAYIRAAGVITQLRKILESAELESLRRVNVGAGIDVYKDIVSHILAVIQGFAPMEEVQVLFERLFFSDRFDPRFVRQLFLGLCTANPEEYGRYVPRFLVLQPPRSTDPSLAFVWLRFVQIVTLPRIAEQFYQLDPYYEEEFLDLLSAYDWSPTIIMEDETCTHTYLVPLGTIPVMHFKLKRVSNHRITDIVKSAELMRNGGAVGLVERVLDALTPPERKPIPT